MIDYILYLILLIAQLLGYHGTAGVISLMMVHKAFAEVLLAELAIKFSFSVAATLAAGDTIAAWIIWVVDGVVVVVSAIWGVGAWLLEGVMAVGAFIWGAGAWVIGGVVTVGSIVWDMGAWLVSGIVTIGVFIWAVIALVASVGVWVWEGLRWAADGLVVVWAFALAFSAWAWQWIEWGAPFALYFIGLAIAYRATVRLLPIIFYTIALLLLPLALIAVFLLSQTSIRGRWFLHMLVAMTLTAFDYSPDWLPKPNHWKAFRGWEVRDEE